MDNGSCCLLEGDPISQIMPPLLILTFVLGVLGNGVALCGFCFHLKTWKASTIYLFNLAVADFLLIVCLPLRTDYYLRRRHWVFEDASCRLVLFMLATNRAGSIVFHTVVAVDRYFRVVHPHHRVNGMSRRAAAGAVCALWALVVLGTLYLLTESHLCPQPHATSCESFIMESANGWHDIMFQLEFFLPLAVIVFCSLRMVWSLRRRRLAGRGRARVRRASRLIVAVAAVFVTCYLPSVLARLYFLWTVSSSACHPSVHAALHVTLSFTYLNSMLDPLVYYFSSPSFPKFYTKLGICGSRPPRPGNAAAPQPPALPQSSRPRVQAAPPELSVLSGQGCELPSSPTV
ncbi:PREDICTED: hydroxycarboxylic acid receptor 1 [Dipodomys ordii]|uniref:Hydroxycarboxylic acid receptor 1 n=1 Tax=Dipodomys ordii TaxID=10020 RepID=A0A1S3FRN1_DIPOR|nr:PREDICTED: hydroxycarboxylic acid receptor 1 [Dipodomys ordii]